MRGERRCRLTPRRKRPWPMDGWPRVRTARAAMAALVCLAGWSVAVGGTTGSVQVVTGGGLTMTVDTRWLDNPGYRPVRIRFVPTAPVTADRRLSVEVLLSRTPAGMGDNLRVVREVEIPAGSGPVVTTVSVPQTDLWYDYPVNVREDGVPVAGLYVPSPVSLLPLPPDRLFVVLPVVLIVGNGPVDTGVLASELPIHEYNRPRMPSEKLEDIARSGEPLPTAARLAAKDLPERWLEYTNLDVVCLSLDELANLAKTRPEAFRAVLHWVAAGGNLWVYGVGSEFVIRGVGQTFPRIGELEDLLGLAPGSKDAASKPTDRGWSRPDLSQLFARGEAMDSLEYRRDVYVDPRTGVIFKRDREPRKPAVGPWTGESHFLLREVQMGQVVALAPENPFPGTSGQWKAVLAAVGPERYLWTRRHGLSTAEQNPDFWNFLIPGVGLVPAVQFGVLITLFMLAIGPANYLLLRRRKRLHLLVVTVPASAAAVTLALFVYALVGDGLGTRVRVRSVTHLDQRAGRAACWSRMSYYAGLTPSAGLRFPAETAVYPLEQMPTAWRGEPPRRRELIWDDDQWLADGWLRARTPTQFVTVRCRPSERGLSIAPIQGDAHHVRVTNRLGTPIRQLLVRTADGTGYWAERVAKDAAVRARRIKLAEGMERLGAAYYENLPRLPAGMYPGSLQTPYQRRRAWRYRPYGRSSQTPSPWTSRLEMSLRMLGWYPPAGGPLPYDGPIPLSAGHPAWRELGRPALGLRPELKPGTYVATVDESPEVATGVPSARQEAGYHVILGEF